MKEITIQLTDAEANLLTQIGSLVLVNFVEKEIKSVANKTIIERYKRRTELKLENSLNDYINQISKEKSQNELGSSLQNQFSGLIKSLKPCQNDL